MHSFIHSTNKIKYLFGSEYSNIRDNDDDDDDDDDDHDHDDHDDDDMEENKIQENSRAMWNVECGMLVGRMCCFFSLINWTID